MARHLLQRFLLTLPALWLVLTLVFLMIHIVPGDPVEQMLGEGAAPGELRAIAPRAGLDQPLLTQYGHYLNADCSWRSRSIVQISGAGAPDYFRAVSRDVELAFLALLVCATIAIPAGVLAAYRRGDARRSSCRGDSRCLVSRCRTSRWGRC